MGGTLEEAFEAWRDYVRELMSDEKKDEKPSGMVVPTVPEFTVDDFELSYFTLVDRCPYCGAKFDEEGTTRDGKPCSHPTKMTPLGGFGAAGGSR